MIVERSFISIHIIYTEKSAAFLAAMHARPGLSWSRVASENAYIDFEMQQETTALCYYAWAAKINRRHDKSFSTTCRGNCRASQGTLGGSATASHSTLRGAGYLASGIANLSRVMSSRHYHLVIFTGSTGAISLQPVPSNFCIGFEVGYPLMPPEGSSC